MAISASTISDTQTLEEFRLEYNKLQSDVSTIESSPTFGASISFEGDTADAYETTLAVTDPTADRTITLPNATGTLVLSGTAFDIDDLDIDGGTDIGAAIVDADLFIVDDGAGGTNRKVTASRILTYAATATLTTAGQGNITSLGTLTALTVDDVAVNGKVVTMTGSSSDTAVLTAGTNGTLSIVTTDAAAAAANITITADGTFEADGTTITLDSAGDIVLDAGGANVTFKDDGTAIGDFSNSSSDFVITSSVQDKDIIFKGDDGGGAVTSLTMDMSAAGKSVFGAAAIGSTLTDATNSGSITLDFETYSNFVLTATGNVTLANPSTESVGQTGIIVLIQDGTGSRTLSTGSQFEWPAGTAGTISTTANAVDVIPYVVDAADSILLGAPQLAFATP